MSFFCRHKPIIIITLGMDDKRPKGKKDVLGIQCRCEKCNKKFASRTESFSDLRDRSDPTDARILTEGIYLKKMLIYEIVYRNPRKKKKISMEPYDTPNINKIVDEMQNDITDFDIDRPANIGAPSDGTQP